MSSKQGNKYDNRLSDRDYSILYGEELINLILCKILLVRKASVILNLLGSPKISIFFQKFPNYSQNYSG